MIVGVVFPSYPLFLGTTLVLVFILVYLLVGLLLTFGCFIFDLGSWYRFLTINHRRKLAVLHPRRLAFLHPCRFALRFVLVFFFSGLLGICGYPLVLLGLCMFGAARLRHHQVRYLFDL